MCYYQVPFFPLVDPTITEIDLLVLPFPPQTGIGTCVDRPRGFAQTLIIFPNRRYEPAWTPSDIVKLVTRVLDFAVATYDFPLAFCTRTSALTLSYAAASASM